MDDHGDGFAGSVSRAGFDAVGTRIDAEQWVVAGQDEAVGLDLRGSDDVAKYIVAHSSTGQLG